MWKQSLYILYAFLLQVLSLPAAGALAYAVDSNVDALYTVDTGTGATTIIGDLHPDADRYMAPTSMAVNPLDGTIYILNGSPESDAGLSTVDPLSGTATLIGPGDYGSIACGSDGTLYGLSDEGIGTIDPETGAITDLGGPPISTIFGLDFNEADGFLYGISDLATTLWKIDPGDGTIADTIPVSCASCAPAGALLFDRDGTLILSDLNSQLWDIDTATGVASNMRVVAGGLMTPQGLGLVPVPPPAISGIWPADAALGEFVSVFIFGENFTTDGSTEVYFNSVRQWLVAPVTTDMLIVRILVSADLFGPVTVTTPSGSATSTNEFGIPLTGLNLTGIWPSDPIIGEWTSIFLFGTEFTTDGSTEVYFNSLRQFLVAPVTSEMLIVRVLGDASLSGTVTVTTPSGSVNSSEPLVFVP